MNLLKFSKMSGAGNDFVVVDCSESAYVFTADSIRKICDRRRGIGADGLILLSKSRVPGCVQVVMEFFNCDGSRAELCGNGLRCAGLFAYEHSLSREPSITFATGGGELCSMEAEQMMLEAKFTNPGFVTQRKPAPLADTEATFVVSNASGTPGETVAVAISLRNNPGIIAAALDVHYDTETLKLVGMTDHALLPSGLFSENYESVPYYVSWNDALGSDNLYTEGELVTLEFLILEQASVGNTEVSVSYQPGNVVNWDLEAVPFRTQAGTITIS